MGDNLVRLIIQEDFGEDAAKVAEIFLKHGEQTLYNIVKLSGIEFLQIKHIMIMLVKHNLVTFHLKPVQDPPVGYKLSETPCKQYLYNLSSGDVIHRLR
jgi:transcription initiation factor IIE alpha subunit